MNELVYDRVCVFANFLRGFFIFYFFASPRLRIRKSISDSNEFSCDKKCRRIFRTCVLIKKFDALERKGKFYFSWKI